MDMQGEYRIPAKRETVWEALNDPEVLKACIAGCEALDRTEDGGLEATVKAKVGPVKATFKGAVRLENINAPESYSIVGEGKGGAAGFAKGGADVSLAEDGDETILTYTVNAKVGGKLAQIGARLVDSTAKKYATDFFEKFVEVAKERNGGAASEAAETEETAAPADSPVDSPAAEEETPVADTVKEDIARAAIDAVDSNSGRKPGLTPTQWILLLVAILAGLTLFFGGDGTVPSGGN